MRGRCQDRCRFTALIVLSACALVASGSAGDQKHVSSEELVKEFQNSQSFYEQFDVAEKLVRLRDTSVLKRLEPYLLDEDRHVRGNAAFVFASLGDERGFDAIRSILKTVHRRDQWVKARWATGRWKVRSHLTDTTPHIFSGI